MSAYPSNGTSLRASVNEFSMCHDGVHGAVFIVASGITAKDFPIEQFADVPMITMNGAISKFESTAILPFFYVCSDTNFRIQQPRLHALAMRSSLRVALWAHELEQLPEPPVGEVYLLKKADDVSLLGAVFKREPYYVRSRVLWNKRARSIGFSKNLQYGYFDARTVVYLALQLAYHAGFTKVFLVGMDLNQSVARFYEQAHTSPSPCGLDEHFERRILPSLRLMANTVMSERFRVYNLSAISRVPDSIIPKVTTEQVVELLAQDR